MGKFDGILLCTDFDGTLARSAKVSKENCDAIRYFQSEGGLFSPATGRPAPFLHNYAAEFIPNAPMVTLNGTQIVRYTENAETDEILYESFLPFDAVCRATEDLRRHVHMTAFRYYSGDMVYKIQLENSNVIEVLSTLPEKLNKMIFQHDGECGAEIVSYLTKIYGREMVFESSWRNGIEGLCVNEGKGNAALRVKEMTGAHILVCAGDYENDISMLRAADIGYAVGNALDSVKAAADRVTVPCAEHAIAAIIRDLERDMTV